MGCGNTETDTCQESACYGIGRICVEVIPFEREPSICEQVVISYTQNDETHTEIDCGHYDSAEWGRLNPISCAGGGQEGEITLSIVQDENRNASTKVLLADHNYCGRDIAYVYVMLNEDGPPSFEETVYVSPCEMSTL